MTNMNKVRIAVKYHIGNFRAKEPGWRRGIWSGFNGFHVGALYFWRHVTVNTHFHVSLFTIHGRGLSAKSPVGISIFFGPDTRQLWYCCPITISLYYQGTGGGLMFIRMNLIWWAILIIRSLDLIFHMILLKPLNGSFFCRTENLI